VSTWRSFQCLQRGRPTRWKSGVPCPGEPLGQPRASSPRWAGRPLLACSVGWLEEWLGAMGVCWIAFASAITWAEFPLPLAAFFLSICSGVHLGL